MMADVSKWEGYVNGVNLGGWLSQCGHTKEHYDSYIAEEDLRKIAAAGYDHVRLPVDYMLVQTKEGQYIEDGFTYIDTCIEWCGKYRLNMVLDLHRTMGYSFDEGYGESGFFETEKYQEMFYALWEEFAKRYGQYADRVSFEILNEIVDKDYMEQWKEIMDKCIKRIRTYAPQTDILVAGYWHSSVMALKDLPLPVDSHIVYNFHCYEPLIFTHQGAGWVKKMPKDYRLSISHTVEELEQESSKVFSGEINCFNFIKDKKKKFGKEFFVDFFAEAVRVAKERSVRLYCGEYGVIDLADKEDAAIWLQAIREAFKECGFGGAVWNYKGLDYEALVGRIMK